MNEPLKPKPQVFNKLNNNLIAYTKGADIDGDGVPNVKDCSPFNKDRHGIGTWIKSKVQGRPYQEIKQEEVAAKVERKEQEKMYKDIEREAYKEEYEKAKLKAVIKRGEERAKTQIKREFAPGQAFGGFSQTMAPIMQGVARTARGVSRSMVPIAGYMQRVAETASSYRMAPTAKPIRKIRRKRARVKVKYVYRKTRKKAGRVRVRRAKAPALTGMAALGQYGLGRTRRGGLF